MSRVTQHTDPDERYSEKLFYPLRGLCVLCGQSMKTLRVHYEGRVQGVGFRYTVKNLAREFEVSGTVANLPDSRVELVASGDPDEVDAFLEAIRTSALAGHISLETSHDIPRPAGLRGFSIVP